MVIREVRTTCNPEALAAHLAGEPGLVLLRTGRFDGPHARHSFLTVRPFLVFQSSGSRCELRTSGRRRVRYGNPWVLLDELLARYELVDELDLPFPLGGCFGWWGYDLKNALEPRLTRRAVNDLNLPDCHLGFHDSLVVFDHHLGRSWIVSTGLDAEGDRSAIRAQSQQDWWLHQTEEAALAEPSLHAPPAKGGARPPASSCDPIGACASTSPRARFLAAVERAQSYIRAGDIYQVNLSQRLQASWARTGWDLFESLARTSPAPFAAYLDCGRFQLASSSPELFLRLSGDAVVTRPIKGTRPRDADPTRDTQLAYELQTSTKEMAELVMITDLLRNDLGRVCEYGSVQVPELVRLERFAHVQHLVSTVEGRLRRGVTHLKALAACFPGGSITGAPKIRAMEIIDELESVARGPYTGALGYLGFNRESQLSVIIRTAIRQGHRAWFHTGAGIVADSQPEAEYEETLAKAQGFLQALQAEARPPRRSRRSVP
jgi:para-aminobenzoate synthetase component 1